MRRRARRCGGRGGVHFPLQPGISYNAFMRIQPAGIQCLSVREIEAIVDQAIRILDEIGMKIESPMICQRLADAGARWDGDAHLSLPRSVIEGHLQAERQQPPAPLQVMDERRISGSVGCYPLRWLDPADGKIKRHTVRSCADLTRIADAIPNIDGIGSVGTPGDVPALLQPLWMRFFSWRYAQNKISNSYTIMDARLCPYIAEFVETVAAMEPTQGGVKRFFRAENYLISPLHYARAEAQQFEWFVEHGYRMTIGNLISAGGTAPVTLAGAISLGLAEMFALSLLHKVFYGDRGLYLHTGISPLDMRTGALPYGRPELVLCSAALSQIARHLGALDEGSLGHGTTAKAADIECGLNKGFEVAMQLAMLGKVHWHFGIFSIDEVYDPALMVIENEFLEGMKRVARGFEVNEETLAFDVIKEVGIGGQFLGHPHTHEHFRQELWLPELFNGAVYESWLGAGGRPILDRARDKVLSILATHHPRGIKEETERALLALLGKYARTLGLPSAKPDLPG